MAVNSKLLVVQIAILFLVFVQVLFLLVGTITWITGWIFLVLFFGINIAFTTMIDPQGKFAYVMTGTSTPNAVIAQFTIDQTTRALTLMNNATVLSGSWPNGIVTVGK
jgi:hypothetical protein